MSILAFALAGRLLGADLPAVRGDEEAGISKPAAPSDVEFDKGLQRDMRGAIIRGDVAAPRAAILVRCRAGNSNLNSLLDALARQEIAASFFPTAENLGEPAARAMLTRMRADGHYVGPQVDGQLTATLSALREIGIAAPGASAFGLLVDANADGALSESSRELSIELVAATPQMKADTLAASLTSQANGNSGSLNGVLLLADLSGGSDSVAIDPTQVAELAEQLTKHGYQPVRIDQLCATAMRPVPRDPRYPSHWWAPVPTAGAPGWEILPHAAGPGEVILSKRHELGLLSNFAPTPFTVHGKLYASLEGFWQMMKFPEGADDPRAEFEGNSWPMTRDEVAAMTAFEAKGAGDVGSKNMKRMGIDWVSFEGRRFPYRPAEPGEHYDLIVAATRAKVDQNPEVRRVLLATGDLLLKPDHHQEINSPAAWRYFDILTEIREELKRSPQAE